MGIRRGSVVGAVFALLALCPLPAMAQIVFTPAEKQVMLDAHNEVRCAVSPTAQVMPALTWSVLLEATAQAWALRCQDFNGDGLIDHNPTRNLGHPYNVGENIWAAGGSYPGQVVAQPRWAVNGWASEQADYNYYTNTCAPGKVCGHYTQIVTASTLQVGCARAFCPLLDYDSVIVCDYGPANYPNPPYPQGSGPNAACGPDLIFADGFES